MGPTRNRPIGRALAVGVAGATFGVLGALAVAEAHDEAPVSVCGPTESDLLRAADAARRLEAERSELFHGSESRATHDDLRLAAEWARRMSHRRPVDGC